MSKPLRHWYRAVLVGCVLFGGAHGGQANINLEWRPAVYTVNVGDVVDLPLYAISTSGVDHPIAAIDLILDWGPAHLRLEGVINNGPYDWLSSEFPDDSPADGLNNTWLDGDAYYLALARWDAPALAPPEGLRVATFRFTALAETSTTEVTIPETAGDYTRTVVWDGEIAGLNILGARGTAMLTIRDCPGCDFDEDGDVDLGDFAVLQSCFGGNDAPPTSVCPVGACSDLDGDEDSDLVDYAIFHKSLTDPS